MKNIVFIVHDTNSIETQRRMDTKAAKKIEKAMIYIELEEMNDDSFWIHFFLYQKKTLKLENKKNTYNDKRKIQKTLKTKTFPIALKSVLKF